MYKAVFLLSEYFIYFLSPFPGRKVEGSQETAKLTAELLRSVISQQRVPYNNQAGALIDAIKAVGEKLIAANPVGKLFTFFCCVFVAMPIGFIFTYGPQESNSERELIPYDYPVF